MIPRDGRGGQPAGMAPDVRGTGDLTYEQVQDQLSDGGHTQVLVEKEATTFIAEVHRTTWRDSTSLFSRLILDPRFDPQDFARVKTNAINALEVNLKSEDDEDLGKEALQWALYPSTPTAILSWAPPGG